MAKSKTPVETEWYRKSPKWHFWDRTKYAKVHCVKKKCDWYLEIYSPYTSWLVPMNWRISITSHVLSAHGKKDKK